MSIEVILSLLLVFNNDFLKIIDLDKIMNVNTRTWYHHFIISLMNYYLTSGLIFRLSMEKKFKIIIMFWGENSWTRSNCVYTNEWTIVFFFALSFYRNPVQGKTFRKCFSLPCRPLAHTSFSQWKNPSVVSSLFCSWALSFKPEFWGKDVQINITVLKFKSRFYL